MITGAASSLAKLPKFNESRVNFPPIQGATIQLRASANTYYYTDCQLPHYTFVQHEIATRNS